MTTTPTVTANTRTPMVEKIRKPSFKVVEGVGAAVVMVAIEEVKPLMVRQPVELTVYPNPIRGIIVRIPVSTATKQVTRVTNAPTLRQKTSCHWQHLRASN